MKIHSFLKSILKSNLGSFHRLMVCRLIVLLSLSLMFVSCGSNQKELAQMSPEYLSHISSLKSFKVDEHQLKYIDQGRGEVYLLLHGIPTNSWMYRKLIKELSKTHRVIAPDLIGFGQSSKPHKALSVKEHAQSLVQLLNKKLKVTNLNMMIHDFGGPIGLTMLGEGEFKVNKAVILDTFVYEEGWKSGYNFFSKNANQALPEMMPGFFFKSGVKGMFNSKISKNTLSGYVGPLKSKNGSQAYSYLYSCIPNIKKEILPLSQKQMIKHFDPKRTKIIWGKKDPFLDSDLQVRRIVEALDLNKKNVLILEKGKHLIADENSQEILKFIK